MNKLSATIMVITTFAVASVWPAAFTPHIYLSIDGGADRTFFETEGTARLFFEPTSQVRRATRPAGTFTADCVIGNYFGFSAGMGFRHFGQSTQPTTVFLKNDIFEHDFESHFQLDYLAVPLIEKEESDTLFTPYSCVLE